MSPIGHYPFTLCSSKGLLETVCRKLTITSSKDKLEGKRGKTPWQFLNREREREKKKMYAIIW